MPKKIVAAKSILKRNSSLLKTQFFIVLTYCADPFYIGYRKVISIFDLSLRDFLHRVKSIQRRSFFWSVISCIQTEYGDLLHKFLNQSEYRKIWIRKDSVFGHFSRSATSNFLHSWEFAWKIFSCFPSFFLGVILYTLLHGRQPFNIDSKSIVNDIVAGKYEVTLHIYTEKKWSFPLRISSVNVTKSAVSCGFGHIHWSNP